MIDLQRSVGNAALTRHLLQRLPTADGGQEQTRDAPSGHEVRIGDAARPADCPSLPVQRLRTADSHPGLARQYDEMMRSPTFQELDALVTAERPIHLVAGRGPGGVYDPAEHSITLPASAPAGTLRRLLLVEMHNAGRSGAIDRIGETFDGPITSLGEHPRYRVAARALAVEWEEWMSIAETHLRGERIDHDLGGRGRHVDQGYAVAFDVPDDGWFDFENYIAEQRRGHTALYDQAAARPGWAGEELLGIVRNQHPALLRITREDVRAFRAGRRDHIVEGADNPFRSLALVRLASERARSAAAAPAETSGRRRGWFRRLLPPWGRGRNR